MTGFGSLYYTDCLPGQGLNGSAGFQFQAASPGLATEAMAVVQRSTLYEPPASWMRERRPAADYPRSLTHTASDGVYATAAGVYLGQEANGSREGNQFTHAVVTDDMKDYGLLRPAQMWGAPWWATAPAPGTELSELPPNPEAGPLDTETVRERVQAAGGADRLMALLSAVERLADPQQRQTVVVVSSDPETAACWIAAATLLLPLKRALRVSFKIFVADAQYGQHDIIVLHPEWAGRWADTGDGQGFVVFDLDRERHTSTEVTESARFWVPRFLSADPLDVVDAVELAGQLAQTRGDDPASGIERMVAGVVAAGERLTDAESLERASAWLVNAPDGAAKIVREPLVDAVLAGGPKVDVLRNLALAIGAQADWGAAKSTVRGGLLTAEISEALAAADGVAAAQWFTRLAPLPAYSAPDTDVRKLESALRGVQRQDQVPALLTVAYRHGICLKTNQYSKQADWFAQWWVDQTGSRAVDGLLSYLEGPEPLLWVRDVLQDRLAKHDARVVDTIRSYWWEPMWRAAHDPTDPLDVAVLCAAYQLLDTHTARELLHRVQGDAATRDPADGGATAWRMIFGTRLPSTTEASNFLKGLQARRIGPSTKVGGLLAQVSDHDPEATDEAALWLSNQLAGLGIPLSPRVGKIQKADSNIRGAINALVKGSQGWSASQIGEVFNDTPQPLFTKRLDDVVSALVEARAERVLEVVRFCEGGVVGKIVAEIVNHSWPRELNLVTPEECRVLALSFRLVLFSDRFSNDQCAHIDQLGRSLERVILNADAGARKKRIDKNLPSDLRDPWSAWVDDLRTGWLKNRLKRGKAPAAEGTDDGRSDKAPTSHAADKKSKSAWSADKNSNSGWSSGKRSER